MPIDSFLDPFRLFSCCLDSSFLHQSIIFCFLFPFRFFLLTQIYIKDILPFRCGSSHFLQIMGSMSTRVPPLLRLNRLANIQWPRSTFNFQLLLQSVSFFCNLLNIGITNYCQSLFSFLFCFYFLPLLCFQLHLFLL